MVGQEKRKKREKEQNKQKLEEAKENVNTTSEAEAGDTKDVNKDEFAIDDENATEESEDKTLLSNTDVHKTSISVSETEDIK